MLKGLFTVKNAGWFGLVAVFVAVLGMMWTSGVLLLLETVSILVLAMYMAHKMRLKSALIAFVGLMAFVYVGSGMNGLLALSAFGAIATFLSNVSAYRSGAFKK